MAEAGARTAHELGLEHELAGLRARCRALEERCEAQRRTVDALVEAAEASAQDVVTHLAMQRIVEQRTERIHHGERVLRAVLDSLDGALCIVGHDGRVLDANSRWPGPVGGDFFAWCADTPDLHELVGEVAEAVTGRIRTPQVPAPVVSVKGQVGPAHDRRWVVMRVHGVMGHAEARAVVTMLDITAGMAAQEQLRRTSQELRQLALVAQATDHAVVITDAQGRIEWVNEPFARSVGRPGHELPGLLRQDLLDPLPRDAEEVRDFLASVARDGAGDAEFAVPAAGGGAGAGAGASGPVRWVQVQVRPVHENGRREHLVWVEQDVTARRETQQRLGATIERAETLTAALRKEKELLDTVINTVPQLIYWKDSAGRYRGCNGAFSAFVGRAAHEIIGTVDAAATHGGDPVGAVLGPVEDDVRRGGRVLDRSVQMVDAQGRTHTMQLSVLRTRGRHGDGLIGVAADVTLTQEMERQLAQANRLESIGQLASGIAHEINTPIQFVTDNTTFVAETVTQMLEALALARTALDLLPGDLPCSGTLDHAEHRCQSSVTAARDLVAALDLEYLQDEVPAALREAREGLGRVAQIVRAMKDYAHPGTARSDVDINHAIGTTVQVCRNEWKYVAEVHLDLSPDAGLVPGYEGELKQVLLNMIVNAAQAIGDDPARGPSDAPGSITIGTARDATHLVVTVADDGPGIPDDIRAKVFDPFFTTKEVGRGTGQGLALAHSIVVGKHGGQIAMDTAVGRGTTFTLKLPLVPPDARDQG